MADRLTQLQDCLDDLLKQMYASLHYIHNRHPYGTIEGQPQGPHFRLAGDDDDKEDKKDKKKGSNAAATNGENDAKPEVTTPEQEDPDKFNTGLRELAQDLVLKEQQIEYIVNSLPGLGNSEQSQEQKMKELERELRELELEREMKEADKQELVAVLGEVIGRVKRVP